MYRFAEILAAVVLGAGLTVGDERAEGAAEELVAAMDLRSVLAVMREEGLASGADLASEMLGGKGGANWQAELLRIYDVDRQMAIVAPVFARNLDGKATEPMLDFFTSELGQRITVLEISARRALLDQGVDDAANLALEEALAENDPRIGLLRAYIASGDLIEANVMGGLNSNFAFYMGFAEAGSNFAMSEEEMLAEVWSQEEQIRADMESWLLSYLLLAYAPLSDDELRAYTDFANTASGRQLNAALLAAFDAVFTDVSRLLGRAVARELQGEDL